jgi:hypothetical protein
MIEGIAVEYTDAVKTFETPNDLAKAYHELNTKVSSGDISLLPEDIRKDPIISRYKNINESSKALIEANKIISGIKKAPETPEGYKFSELQNLHKGLTNIDETKKGLALMFHKVGLDNEKGDALQQMILTALSTGLGKNDENRAAKSKEVETKLRGEWGVNYDKNFGNVKNVLERIGLGDLVTDLAQNPQRIAGFHKLTSLLSEDSIANLGAEGSGSGGEPKTNAEGLAALKTFNEEVTAKGRSHPLLDDKNPEHKKTVEKYNKLMNIVYGTKQ